MAKKKGRQSGRFPSKSMNAAHQWEEHHHACEVLTGFVCQRINKERQHGYATAIHDPSLPSGPSLAKLPPGMYRALPTFRSQRPTIQGSTGLLHLRHLLQERQLEDRHSFKLHRHRRAVNESYQQKTKGTEDEELEMNEIGWTLQYLHPDDLKKEFLRSKLLDEQSRCKQLISTARRRKAEESFSQPPWNPSLCSHLQHDHYVFDHSMRSSTATFPTCGTGPPTSLSKGPPTLVTLCIHALGAKDVLAAYINHYGFLTMHSVLSTFPSSILTSLSVCVAQSLQQQQQKGHQKRIRDDDDDREGVLRAMCTHAHVESLVCWGITDTILEEMTPTRHVDVIEGTINDCWEEAEEDEFSHDVQDTLYNITAPCIARHSLRLSGCRSITRIELINAPYLRLSTLVSFLDKCPSITHLRLSNVLDSTTGPLLLFKYLLQGSNSCTSPEDDWYAAQDYRPDDCEEGIPPPKTASISAQNQCRGRLLTALQVLDLSHNYWLDALLLRDFLDRWCSERGVNMLLVNVHGCPQVSFKVCEAMTARFASRPCVTMEQQTMPLSTAW